MFNYKNLKIHLSKKFNTIIKTKHFHYIITTSEELIPYIGIIIRKKTIKHSVQRNLCRRLNKEMFRCNKKQLYNKNLIVIVTKHANKATRNDLWQSINFFIEQYKK